MRKLLLNSTAIATVAALTSGVALADVSISAATEWNYNSRSSQITANDGTTFGNVSEMLFKFTNKLSGSSHDIGACFMKISIRQKAIDTQLRTFSK